MVAAVLSSRAALEGACRPLDAGYHEVRINMYDFDIRFRVIIFELFHLPSDNVVLLLSSHIGSFFHIKPLLLYTRHHQHTHSSVRPDSSYQKQDYQTYYFEVPTTWYVMQTYTL